MTLPYLDIWWSWFASLNHFAMLILGVKSLTPLFVVLSCFLQMWSWVLLFLWGRVQGRPTDLSMCLMGWGYKLRRLISLTVRTGLWAVGLGDLQFPTDDNGCLHRSGAIPSRPYPTVPSRWLQPQRPQHVPTDLLTPSLHRLIWGCH